MCNEERMKSIETLVSDCYFAHQEAIIVKLICGLEEEYSELAKVITAGEYDSSWTHKKLLDYITYER